MVALSGDLGTVVGMSKMDKYTSKTRNQLRVGDFVTVTAHKSKGGHWCLYPRGEVVKTQTFVGVVLHKQSRTSRAFGGVHLAALSVVGGDVCTQAVYVNDNSYDAPEFRAVVVELLSAAEREALAACVWSHRFRFVKERKPRGKVLAFSDFGASFWCGLGAVGSLPAGEVFASMWSDWSGSFDELRETAEALAS